MSKNFVIDTNVLLIDPDAIFQFGANNVILPLTVIEEVDTFKKPKRPDQAEEARAARQFARNMKSLRALGRVDEGVPLPNGGTLKVVLTISQTVLRLPLDLESDVNDNRILSVAVDYKATVITNDVNMGIKAEALGLNAEEYSATAIKSEDFYTGTGKGYVSGEDLERIYAEKCIQPSDVDFDGELHPNQCFILESKDNHKQAALVRYNAAYKEFVLVPDEMKTLGLEPKNAEQHQALGLLHDPEIKLVSMIGKAGSGKTLLALAAGLYGATVTKEYTKVLLLKPIVSMDNSHQLGYLPGSMEEKLAPWLSSYYDNIDFIMGRNEYEDPPKLKKDKKKRDNQNDPYMASWNEKKAATVSKAEELMALGVLEIGSLEHIRGRSLPNQFIIIDEAQGLTHNAIKTIITRAGEGTKIVLMGDIEQIDLPYLSADNNGLVYVADRMKHCDISGHITLTKTVRSKLAELAAELL